MHIPKSAEVVASSGLALGCVLMLTAGLGLFVLGSLVAFASVAWYAAAGIYPSGWSKRWLAAPEPRRQPPVLPQPRDDADDWDEVGA